MKEHLHDPKIVYRNQHLEPVAKILSNYSCADRHCLEALEKKYINRYARKGNVVLNTRMVDRQ